MTREDLILLAIADDLRTSGRCAACGQDTAPNARWCPGCYVIKERLLDTLRYKPRPKTGQCERCGDEYERTSGNQRWCPGCAVVINRERSRDYWRRKRGFQPERYCMDCGEDISKRRGAKRCVPCAARYKREYNAEYRRMMKEEAA